MPMIQKTKPTSMTEVNSELYKSNMWRPQADLKTGGSDVIAMNAVQEGKSSGQRLAETLGVTAGLVKESVVAAATYDKYAAAEGIKVDASIIGFGDAYQNALKENGHFLDRPKEERQRLISGLRDTYYIQYLGNYDPEVIKKHQRLLDAKLMQTELLLQNAYDKANSAEVNAASSVNVGKMINDQMKHVNQVWSYGNRPDGTAKGEGWLGPIPLTHPDGSTGVMTEVTIGTELEGKQYDMPLLVPGLNPEEIKAVGAFVMAPNKTEEDKKNKWALLPQSVLDKAEEHLKNSLKYKTPIYKEFNPAVDIRQSITEYYDKNVAGIPGAPTKEAFSKAAMNELGSKAKAFANNGDFRAANLLLQVLRTPDASGVAWDKTPNVKGDPMFGQDIDLIEKGVIDITKAYRVQQEKDKKDLKEKVNGELLIMVFDPNTDAKLFDEKLIGELRQGNITPEEYSSNKQLFFKAKNGGLAEDSLDLVTTLRWNAQTGKLSQKEFLAMIKSGQVQSRTTVNQVMGDLSAYQASLKQGDKESEGFYMKEAKIYLDSLMGLKQTMDIHMDPKGASKVNGAIQAYKLDILHNKPIPSVAYDAALKRFGIKTYQEANPTNETVTTGNPKGEAGKTSSKKTAVLPTGSSNPMYKSPNNVKAAKSVLKQ